MKKKRTRLVYVGIGAAAAGADKLYNMLVHKPRPRKKVKRKFGTYRKY